MIRLPTLRIVKVSIAVSLGVYMPRLLQNEILRPCLHEVAGSKITIHNRDVHPLNIELCLPCVRCLAQLPNGTAEVGRVPIQYTRELLDCMGSGVHYLSNCALQQDGTVVTAVSFQNRHDINKTLKGP